MKSGRHGQGLVALVGVTHTDTEATSRGGWLKSFGNCGFSTRSGRPPMSRAPILVVSQFTLYANTVKGRRPTWNAAASGAVAEPLVTVFTEALRELGAEVATGVFGADMAVELVNDGPVTVMLEL